MAQLVNGDKSDEGAHQTDVDVIVIGSGAAGLCAALTAVDRGATRVLIAEAEGIVGGSSRLSGGLVMGAGTRYQAALGIEDDADSLFHDYLTVNRWNVDAGVVRRLADLAGPTVDWLGDLGVEFAEQLVFGGDERVPRVHVPVGRGAGVVEVLTRHVREAGVDIALGQRVDRLVMRDGAVVGVAVGEDEITADAVVIASGGFANAPELLERHFPSAAQTGNAWYIGADGSRGDALGLAEQVDAQLIGHDRGLRLLHTGFAQIYEAYLPGWLVLLNGSGHRFCDETAPYGMMDFLVREQGNAVYAILDHAVLEQTATGQARYKQLIPGAKNKSPHWNLDVIEQMSKDGKVVRGDSLEEVAQGLGLPTRAMVGAIARYNSHVAAGRDTDFAKAAKFLEPVETPPFYGVVMKPSTVCFTAYGLRIDADARVLDTAGSPIPGLFAAGECTGGVVGAQYVGSGNSYANCTVFGRIAGAAAAGKPLD